MVLLSFGEERIGGAYILRNESEEKSFREMLTPTKSELGSSEEREEAESSKKDKPHLTKMMTLPLEPVTLVKKILDREWVPTDRRDENPGIRKEKIN